MGLFFTKYIFTSDRPFFYTVENLFDDEKILNEFKKKAHDQLSVDGGGHLTYLAPSRVNLQLMQERYPDIVFHNTREH